MPCLSNPPKSPIKHDSLTNWGVSVSEINRLWEYTRGSGLKVALLDSGVTPNHPDLVHAVKANQCRDFTDSVYGARDIRGHGTHCAGLICGRHSGKRKLGLVPKAELIVAKVLPDRRPAREVNFLNAVEWALEQGADVFSMSSVNQSEMSMLHDAVMMAINAGKFVFCSAANHFHKQEEVPAAYPETIAVGSIRMQPHRPRFSSMGDEENVVAPGEGLLSTYPPYGYRYLNGSSVATAFAAGVGALVLSHQRKMQSETSIEDPLNPSGNQQRLKDHLVRTAIEPEAAMHDPRYGYGMLSIEAAFAQ